MSCNGDMHFSRFKGQRISSLSREAIEEIQKLIGAKVDGRDGPDFRFALERYEKKHKLGHHHQKTGEALLVRR